MHLLAGPNGAGKTTFHEYILGPATHLPSINADHIALREWPGDEEAHGHEAAAMAQTAREQAMARGESFITETVFSHPSKLDLIEAAQAENYWVSLHVMLVPEALTVVRTRLRSGQGGHSVPEVKVRQRYRRLWPLIERAIEMADEVFVYDNSSARKPFRIVARYQGGEALMEDFPGWSPLG